MKQFILGRIRVSDTVAMELHPTPFGVCCIFFRGGLRVASLSCEPRGLNTFCLESNPDVYERFTGSFLEAVERIG
jgi:hypothetical protein